MLREEILLSEKSTVNETVRINPAMLLGADFLFHRPGSIVWYTKHQHHQRSDQQFGMGNHARQGRIYVDRQFQRHPAIRWKKL
jgi:hypothetical protein